MDTQTEKDIRNSFRTEYMEKAVPEMTGVSGWVVKQATRFAKKMQALQEKKSPLLPAYIAGSGLLLMAVLTVGFAAAPLATVALSASPSGAA